MPTYSYECGCGMEEDVVLTVREMEAVGLVCVCGKKMVRVYKTANLTRDKYMCARVRSDLNALDNDPGKTAVFTHRTEEKAYLEEHNRRFGTEYKY